MLIKLIVGFAIHAIRECNIIVLYEYPIIYFKWKRNYKKDKGKYSHKTRTNKKKSDKSGTLIKKG